MKTFTVVIHYEGAMDYEIEAHDIEEAKEKACRLFEVVDIGKLKNMDWDICDSWEEN